MKVIPAGQFKTHCLALIKDVDQNNETLIITRHGKPVARVLPFASDDETEEALREHGLALEIDLIEPIGETWATDL